MKKPTGQVLIDIKKALYKEKPIARCFENTKIAFLYDAIITENVQVFFRVPIADMGGKEFEPKIQAQLLIRWITDYDTLGDQTTFDD